MHPMNDDSTAAVTTYAASALAVLSHVDWIFWIGLVLLAARLVREIPPAIEVVAKFIRWVRSKL